MHPRESFFLFRTFFAKIFRFVFFLKITKKFLFWTLMVARKTRFLEKRKKFKNAKNGLYFWCQFLDQNLTIFAKNPKSDQKFWGPQKIWGQKKNAPQKKVPKNDQNSGF